MIRNILYSLGFGRKEVELCERAQKVRDCQERIAREMEELSKRDFDVDSDSIFGD